MAHCGKTRNSLYRALTKKIFREINSLVKQLLSRNFLQRCKRENFRNFQTVYGMIDAQCGNSTILLPNTVYLFQME